jgi:hypothetical protein
MSVLSLLNSLYTFVTLLIPSLTGCLTRLEITFEGISSSSVKKFKQDHAIFAHGKDNVGGGAGPLGEALCRCRGPNKILFILLFIIIIQFSVNSV